MFEPGFIALRCDTQDASGGIDSSILLFLFRAKWPLMWRVFQGTGSQTHSNYLGGSLTAILY